MTEPTGRRKAIGLVLFLATIAYLWSLPHSLGWADEAYFLYESKRLADGQILYRDVFQFLTPFAPYAMAGTFSIFGTTIATARLATAVIHGLTVWMLWYASRVVGIRASLALLPAAAYMAVSQSTWPFASWHWFGTCETALLLLVLVRPPAWQRPTAMLLPGIVSGLLIATQQQKGVVMAVAAAAIIIGEYVLRWRANLSSEGPALGTRLLTLGSGAVLVAGSALLIMVALAGFTPLFDAVVRFPLQSYPARARSPWGFVGPISAHFGLATFPTLLKYLPLLMIPQTLIVLVALGRGTMSPQVRPALVVLMLGIASAISILYAPDYIHIAFIAPLFYFAAAQWLEWLFAKIPPQGATIAGGIVATFIIAATTLHLYRNATRARADHPLPHETAFGRIDFEHRWQIVLIDTVRALLDRDPSRTLFCYPSISAPYLLANGTNPTPYQFFLAGVSPPAQIERVLQILTTRDVPYILYLPIFAGKGDPIRRYIDEHYRFAEIPALANVTPAANVWLLERNDLPPAAQRLAAP
jgi:hypothetical protein